MRRRRRRSRSQEEVELNLAAMLDMAFQLLAFFVLTFRPSPIEGELALNMPPPRPMTNVASTDAAPTDSAGAVLAEHSLVIGVYADENGGVSSVRLDFAGVVFDGPADDDNLQRLNQRLRDVFGFQDTPFDQVVIRMDPVLRYEELMKIMDVCLKQQLPDGKFLQKLSFLLMSDEEARQF